MVIYVKTDLIQLQSCIFIWSRDDLYSSIIFYLIVEIDCIHTSKDPAIIEPFVIFKRYTYQNLHKSTFSYRLVKNHFSECFSYFLLFTWLKFFKKFIDWLKLGIYYFIKYLKYISICYSFGSLWRKNLIVFWWRITYLYLLNVYYLPSEILRNLN